MAELTERQANFLHFIKTQDPDRQIINNSWSSCAVGQFFDEVENSPILLLDETSIDTVRKLFGIYTDAQYSLTENKMNSLYECLNNSDFSTYGELQEYINEHGESCITDYSHIE